jgi:hypothetical protein
MDKNEGKVKYDKSLCIDLLKSKQSQLHESGESRFPRRSDFAVDEVVAIKAFLGPWPRALEAAGIKEPRDISRKQMNIDKRIRAKRRRTAAKTAKKNETGNPADNIQ